MYTDIHYYLEQLKYVEKIYGGMNIIENEFLCPICFNKFSANMLTKEHVPPHSLGGKNIVFTCKSCNNTAGHTIEGHLKSALEFFKNKTFPKGLNIHVNIDFGQNDNLRGKIIRRGIDQLTLYIDEKNNNPKIIEEMNHKISLGEKVLTINPATRHKILNERIIISLLKTAYLQLFWRFGYIPIYDSYFQPLRDQIMNPHKIIYPLQLSYLTDEDMPIKNGVNIFELYNSKFVISSFKLNYEDIIKQFNIIIPLFISKNGIGCDASYLYYNFKKLGNSNKLEGNTISETIRPIISNECIPVSNQLINIFY